MQILNNLSMYFRINNSIKTMISNKYAMSSFCLQKIPEKSDYVYQLSITPREYTNLQHLVSQRYRPGRTLLIIGDLTRTDVWRWYGRKPGYTRRIILWIWLFFIGIFLCSINGFCLHSNNSRSYLPFLTFFRKFQIYYCLIYFVQI